MDLRQLRYFIALTEHRSFVRAAEAMGITQPAFSRAIQGLEQTLGCPLSTAPARPFNPPLKDRSYCNMPGAWSRGPRN